jgi:hypothetical protein
MGTSRCREDAPDGEDLVLRLVGEERGDERAAGLDQGHEPGRTARAGDLGQRVDLGAQPALVTAVPSGDVHAVDPRVRQRGDHLPGHPLLLLGAQGVLADEGPHLPYAFDEAGIGAGC